VLQKKFEVIVLFNKLTWNNRVNFLWAWCCQFTCRLYRHRHVCSRSRENFLLSIGFPSVRIRLWLSSSDCPVLLRVIWVLPDNLDIRPRRDKYFQPLPVNVKFIFLSSVITWFTWFRCCSNRNKCQVNKHSCDSLMSVYLNYFLCSLVWLGVFLYIFKCPVVSLFIFLAI
jgi:hypothetical protein